MALGRWDEASSGPESRWVQRHGLRYSRMEPGRTADAWGGREWSCAERQKLGGTGIAPGSLAGASDGPEWRWPDQQELVTVRIGAGQAGSSGALVLLYRFSDKIWNLGAPRALRGRKPPLPQILPARRARTQDDAVAFSCFSCEKAWTECPV